jgi:hypothetical protein
VGLSWSAEKAKLEWEEGNNLKGRGKTAYHNDNLKFSFVCFTKLKAITSHPPIMY